MSSIRQLHWSAVLACAGRFLAGSLFAATATLSQAQSLNVSSGGTPSYNFPINVPPGIHGAAPNLSLAYTAGGENGVVGYGWSVQGISVITRCRGNRRLDGAVTAVAYGINDKLCLDGQRLIQTDADGNVVNASMTNPGITNPFQQNDSAGGSGLVREYRTENDSYARIRAYGAAGGNAANGPAYFKVWTKGGQIYEFGINSNTTSNAQIGVTGQSVVASWVVSRISDTVGNFIDFQYDQRDVAWGSGFVSGTASSGREWNLTEIRYSGTPSQLPANRIVFAYSDRADTPGAAQDRSESYRLGAKSVTIRRLERIHTYVNWPGDQASKPTTALAAKTFKLIYDNGPISGRSRLHQIAECAGESDTRCLPPTTFNYSAGGDVAYTANAWFKGSSLATLPMQNVAGSLGVITGDFFGTGRNAILRWSDNPAENRLYKSEANGTFTDVSPDAGGPFNITDQNLSKSDACYATVNADFNGDGLTDLLRVTRQVSKDDVTCPVQRNILYLSNGDGSFRATDITGISFDQKAAVTYKRYNCALPRSTGYITNCQDEGATYLGTQQTWGFNFYLLDVNNDGLLDIITTESPAYALTLNTPNYATRCATEVCTHVYLNQGNSSFAELTTTNLAHNSVYASPIGTATSSDLRSYVADINDDGVDDLVVENGVWLSRGDGNFDASTDTINGTLTAFSACTNPLDVNGDGMADCLIPSMGQLSVSEGTSNFRNTTNFNLNIASGQRLYVSGTVAPSVTSEVGDFAGDGRSGILRVGDDVTKNAIFLSNGDGQFRAAAAFNLTSANDQLEKSDGTVGFTLGDFTGHGNTEILRMVQSPDTSSDAKRNALYIKNDNSPVDQLTSVTSGTGLTTTFTWIPLSNSISGSQGERYTNDRGTANAAVFPMSDLTVPTFVVATSVADTGVGAATLTTEYSYAGMKMAYDGRGPLGFRSRQRQSTSPATNQSLLTETVQYLQTATSAGSPSITELRLGALNTPSAPVLSRTTNIYCDTLAPGAETAASSSAPCPSAAQLRRPYLYQSVVENFDLNSGAALPKSTTTYAVNSNGDPTQIVTRNEGTAVGQSQASITTVSMPSYFVNTAGDNWLIGKPTNVTTTRTVPDSLSSLAISAGTAQNATTTVGSVPGPLSVKLSTTDFTTNAPGPGVTGATVTAFPQGGLAPYRFAWTRTVGSRSYINDATIVNPTILANLGAGENFAETWNMVVTDGTGSTATAQVTIHFTSAATLAVGISPNPSVVNAGDAGGPYASPSGATVSGGVAPYNYSWTRVAGSRSTADAPNAAYPSIKATLSYNDNFTDTWSVTVGDAAGHSASATVNTTFTAPPPPFVVSLQSSYGYNGSGPVSAAIGASASVSGGTPPYSYSWSRRSGNRLTISNGGIPNPTFTAALGWNENFSEVWDFVASDAAGKTGSGSTTLSMTTPPSPPSLALSGCSSTTPVQAPASASMSCTLTNNGQSAASSISYSNPSGYAMSGPSSCAGQSNCGVVTITSPGVPGSYANTLTVTPNTGSGASAGFAFTVDQGITSVSLSSNPLAFGTVPKTGTPGRAITVTNTGPYIVLGLTWSISNKSTNQDSEFLPGSGTCSTSLATGNSCTIVVDMIVGCVAGSKSGTLSVSGSNLALVQSTISAAVPSSGTCR